MIRRAIASAAKWVAILLLVALVALAAFTDPHPLTRAQISAMTGQLNEAAAVGVPQDFLISDGLRQAHGALLARVERGEPLDEEDSIAYRLVYQRILTDNQSFLARFDRQLTILDDVAMALGNNCGSSGIAGRHDHHDRSARENFAGLLTSLDRLEAAQGWSGSPARILASAHAYKDLVDLISHMGVMPHTLSVPYAPPEIAWKDAALGGSFEAMLAAYKQAQFAPVHSPAYWAAVDTALAAYDRLIVAVQDRIVTRTSPFERRLSGRFLSPQTLAPPIAMNRVLRPRKNP